MIRRYPWAGVAATALCSLSAQAVAQDSRSAGVEVASEEERRGLSWSEGRAVLAADAALSLGRIDASARLVTTRDSDRHAGADAVVDLNIGTGWDIGAIRLSAGATGHLFAGARQGMDYVEARAAAGYGYGPLYATIGVVAAPSQRAIGGSNVYTYASANAGIPGTPFTVLTELGHSSGSIDDAIRAQRLRPGGSYTNWRLGVEHRRGPLTLGVDYIGTDIARDAAIGPFADARHATDRLVGRARFIF